MHVEHVKTRLNQGGMLVVGLLLAAVLAFAPHAAQAAGEGWPHWGGGSALPGFWLTGEVTAVEEGSVTLQLPNKHHARGMMRYVSLQVELEIISDTVLLDGDLGTLDLTTLAEGDDVVVVPRLVWGNLVAQLLYAGEPEALAEASYRGELVADEGDTLTLDNRREGEFTVVVGEETIWYDNGRMERPAELPEEMNLRVLGVEEENEAGDDVIRAVLITPAR